MPDDRRCYIIDDCDGSLESSPINSCIDLRRWSIRSNGYDSLILHFFTLPLHLNFTPFLHVSMVSGFSMVSVVRSQFTLLELTSMISISQSFHSILGSSIGSYGPLQSSVSFRSLCIRHEYACIYLLHITLVHIEFIMQSLEHTFEFRIELYILINKYLHKRLSSTWSSMLVALFHTLPIGLNPTL